MGILWESRYHVKATQLASGMGEANRICRRFKFVSAIASGAVAPSEVRGRYWNSNVTELNRRIYVGEEDGNSLWGRCEGVSMV